MAHYYESNSNSSGPSTAAELLDEGNEWSTYSEVVQVIETPMQKAKKEWRKWEQWCHPAYLPEMKPTRVLSAADNEDQPNAPVYALGKVTKRGTNLDNGLNHADYVNNDGLYNLLQ